MSKIYEIRDPIHGFIELNEWELAIVNHPAFQRLRRIRQLGLSELIYPGTTHTRFEHSLGVLHIGTRMFDQIVKKRSRFLQEELEFTEEGLKRDRIIVRMACLLHDIGHSPFSHAGEDIMPLKENGKRYKHEDYSAEIIRLVLHDVIETHSVNQNFEIKADDIANLIEGKVTLGRRMLWHNIVSSQLDADRSDYLLRDSYHAGVSYGHYDLDRIIATLTVALDDNSNPVFAIEYGGFHAAEALILARYMMFWQVYFQKTRRICDYHATEAVKELLSVYFPETKVFPPPTSKENIRKYLSWDDYRVFGEMHNDKCGRHSKCLFERQHDRCVYQSEEMISVEDLSDLKEVERQLNKVKRELGDDITFSDEASSMWYKPNDNEIPIFKDGKIINLSQLSPIIKGLKKSGVHRIYVPIEKRDTACKVIN